MTDLDGIVQLGEHFLVIEFKRPNAPIPQGQALMFKKMVARGTFTVIVVYATGQDVESWTVMESSGSRHVEGNREALRTEVRSWSRAHDARPVADDVALSTCPPSVPAASRWLR